MRKKHLTISQHPHQRAEHLNHNEIDRTYRNEVIRKAIHFCSVIIPIFYFFTPQTLALFIVIPLTIIFVGLDIARYYHRPLGDFFYKTFGFILRKHESDENNKSLNGATSVLIAATLCILIFPKFIAITAFIILIISDMTSALIGRKYGRRKFFGKSLEGSIAFFLSAVIVIVLTPKIEYTMGEYLIGAFAAAVGAVVEAQNISIDDNITIPMSVGGTLWLGYIMFFPVMNLDKFG